MANSSLKNNKYPVPDSIITKIQKMVNKNSDESAKGAKKAKGILSSKEMTYPQMKMMLTFFNNCDLEVDKQEFDLLGGEDMKNWVTKMLRIDRNSIHHSKKIAMETGKENAFRKTHTKDKDNANPTVVRMPNISKGSANRNIMSNTTVYENEVKHMQYLIEYFNNNNKII